MNWQEDFKRDGAMSQIMKRLNDLEAFMREFRLKKFGTGGSSGMTLIDDVVVGGAGAANINFSGIPATYKHLMIRFIGRTNRAATNERINIYFNGDTGNNYVGRIQWQTGGVSSVDQVAAGAPFAVTWTAAANSPANYFSNSNITIFDYADANKYNSYQGRGGDFEDNLANTIYLYDATGMWLSLTAINQITLVPNSGGSFVQYSRATLYGLS